MFLHLQSKFLLHFSTLALLTSCVAVVAVKPTASLHGTWLLEHMAKQELDFKVFAPTALLQGTSRWEHMEKQESYFEVFVPTTLLHRPA